MAREVARVLRGVGLHVATDHGDALGADRMVGRGRPLERDHRQVVAAREGAARRVLVRAEQHGVARGGGNRAPQARPIEPEFRRVSPAGGRRHLPRRRAPQRLLRAIDQRDHAFIGFARGSPEREDAVVQEHHADGVRRRLAREDVGAQAREVEARHHVGDHHHRVAVERADALLPVDAVGDGEHRVGVGVLDELVGKDRVQDRFHRRGRRLGAQHVGAHLVHHLRIAQLAQPGERHEVRHLHRGEAGLLDVLEVPAAALHVEHFALAPEEVRLAHLHRGVAASMQDQRLVAPQQPRGIDAQPEVAGESRGLRVVPQVQHGSTIPESPKTK